MESIIDLEPPKKYDWKCVNVKVRPDELPILNQRLKLFGYTTSGQLVRDFLTSKFPPITEVRQIQAMDNNIQSNGLNTILNGAFEPTFYKNIDRKIAQVLLSTRDCKLIKSNTLIMF